MRLQYQEPEPSGVEGKDETPAEWWFRETHLRDHIEDFQKELDKANRVIIIRARGFGKRVFFQWLINKHKK